MSSRFGASSPSKMQATPSSRFESSPAYTGKFGSLDGSRGKTQGVKVAPLPLYRLSLCLSLVSDGTYFFMLSVSICISCLAVLMFNTSQPIYKYLHVIGVHGSRAMTAFVAIIRISFSFFLNETF